MRRHLTRQTLLAALIGAVLMLLGVGVYRLSQDYRSLRTLIQWAPQAAKDIAALKAEMAKR